MNKRLLEAAKDAISKVFSDCSVPRSETKEAIEELADLIDDMLKTLDFVDK